MYIYIYLYTHTFLCLLNVFLELYIMYTLHISWCIPVYHDALRPGLECILNMSLFITFSLPRPWGKGLCQDEMWHLSLATCYFYLYNTIMKSYILYNIYCRCFNILQTVSVLDIMCSEAFIYEEFICGSWNSTTDYFKFIWI